MLQSHLTTACKGHRSQLDHLLLQMRSSQALYEDHLLSGDEYIRDVEIILGQFIVEAEAVLSSIGEDMPEPGLSNRHKT